MYIICFKLKMPMRMRKSSDELFVINTIVVHTIKSIP